MFIQEILMTTDLAHPNTSPPLFNLGQVVATPGALTKMNALNIQPTDLLMRHVTGDWSNMGEEDCLSNQEAVQQGFRVFSAFVFNEQKLWVITEADRSSTTILLPEEY